MLVLPIKILRIKSEKLKFDFKKFLSERVAAGQAQWLASGWKAASGATVHSALCTVCALCTGAGAPPQVCEPGRNLAHRPTSHNTAAKEKTPFLLPKVITWANTAVWANNFVLAVCAWVL